MDETFDLPQCPECLGRLELIDTDDGAVLTCLLCGHVGETVELPRTTRPTAGDSLPGTDDYRSEKYVSRLRDTHHERRGSHHPNIW